MKHAIIFGGTGFIGTLLLQDLLNDVDYTTVTAVVRKPLDFSHPKLKIIQADFKTLADVKDQIKADDVFIALGTTKKNTPDKNEYYHIDHDYPVLAAKIAQENGATGVFVVTSVGANVNSSFFYVRTKGETEHDIIALGFARTGIFRPSMLLGERKEFRAAEKSIMAIWKLITRILSGKLTLYKGIEGKVVAKAMLRAAQQQTEKVKIYHWAEMQP
jgi:uncharacterized protein YbjT (DUF2867 family)